MGPSYAPAAETRTNTLAIVSLATGIGSFFAHVVPALGGFTVALIALITGYMARQADVEMGEKGMGIGHWVIIGAAPGAYVLVIIGGAFPGVRVRHRVLFSTSRLGTRPGRSRPRRGQPGEKPKRKTLQRPTLDQTRAKSDQPINVPARLSRLASPTQLIDIETANARPNQAGSVRLWRSVKSPISNGPFAAPKMMIAAGPRAARSRRAGSRRPRR